MTDGVSTENTAWLSTTSDRENRGNCAWIRIRTTTTTTIQTFYSILNKVYNITVLI
jgi:hypothetical protein